MKIEFRRRFSQRFCSRRCWYESGLTPSLRGSRNRRWRGGKALSYGPGWKQIKLQVRARDGVCRTCGKTPEQNGRALDVHHLDPYRFSGNNDLRNLLALCRSCHMRADDHGRAGSARFTRATEPKRPTKREIRRLRQLARMAEARAKRRAAQRAAHDMARAGSSLREIARAVGCSHQTVANWLGGQYRVQERGPRYRTRCRIRLPRRRPRLLSCPPPLGAR